MATANEGGETGACWLHPDAHILASAIEGRGLFAARPLAAGTSVAILAGRLVGDEELGLLLAVARSRQRYLDTICVDDDVHLVLPPGQPIHYGNHSCDPTLWHAGAYTLAACRDIGAGEELTVDYATQTAAAGFRMPCRCGTAGCRGIITGNDWRLPRWRDRFREHVVPAVARRINAST